MHVFEAEATVAFITNMHQVTIFLCVYLVWKQPLTIQISSYVYCFLLMANMGFCAAVIELNRTPCISEDFQIGPNVQLVHQWELWLSI